jgi:hypothetical protein
MYHRAIIKHRIRNEVNNLVGALGNIEIQSVEENFQKSNDQTETREKIEESPLPFHLRMKIYTLYLSIIN